MINAARTEEVATSDAQFNTAYIYAVSIVAALGGLLFGYDWVVIGGAKPFYKKYFGLTDPSQQGWAMSCALVGFLIGALMRQICVAGFLFIKACLPETKGKTLEQIEGLWNGNE